MTTELLPPSPATDSPAPSPSEPAATKPAKKARVQKTEEQILDDLHKKIEQVKADFADRKARELAKATRGSSAQETKKKILVGAFVLNHHTDATTLAFGDVRFVDFLVRADDRKLFGLMPLIKAATETTDPVSVPSAAPVVDAVPIPLPYSIAAVVEAPVEPVPVPVVADFVPADVAPESAADDAPLISDEVVYLVSEFHEQNEIKAIRGSKWYPKPIEKWGVKAGHDLRPFAKWLPQ